MLTVKKHSYGPVTGFEVGIAPMGKPIKSVYLYHLDSLLIDTGPHHLRGKVAPLITSTMVSQILLTHHHEDHSGNGALFQEKCGAPVFLHPYGVAKLAKGFNILPYQHILFGKAPRLEAQECPRTIESDTIALQALHTPGHSRDHTVFYAAQEGWLFSGDLYVGEKIQFFRVDENIGQQIASLRKVVQLDFDVLFCAHRPSRKNGRTLIKRKLNYLESFNQQVHDLHRKGVVEKEIVRRLQVKNDLPVKLFTMGNACFSHMVRSSLGTFSDHRDSSGPG